MPIINRHQCSIPIGEKTFQLRTPYDTRFQQIYKWIRNKLTVDKNPVSHIYFRSYAAFRRERERHLTRHKWIIHPFSNFIQMKNIFVTFVWLLLYFNEAYFGTFLTENKNLVVWIDKFLLVGNLIALGDIILRFFTGYAISKTRRVVLDPKDIAKKYLKTYFIADLAPICSYLFYYFGAYPDEKTQFLCYQLHRLRILRIKTVLFNVDQAMKFLGFHLAKRFFTSLVVICISLLHTLTCLRGTIDLFRKIYKLNEENSWLKLYKMIHEKPLEYAINLYMLNLLTTSSHFFGIGGHVHQSDDAAEMVFLSLVLTTGMIFHVYAFSKILQLFGVVNMAEGEYEQILLQAEYYMVHQEFRSQLRKRIYKFLDYKFNKVYFNENKIMNSLTEHLRMEVLLYSCQHLIQRVQVFRGLSKAAIGCMLALFKQEIYVAGDEIMSYGDETGAIYFILYGTCGINVESGKEVGHIEDGDYFGDSTKFVDSTTGRLLYSVVALEVSEVYKLDLRDINYCLKNYPEIADRMGNLIRVKTREYDLIAFSRLDVEDKTEDIVKDLRMGKILFHGITRKALGY